MRKIIVFLFAALPLASYSQNTVKAKVFLLQRVLAKKHYKPLVWNDTSASILFKKWINNLDDEKLFFTQKDIDALTRLKTAIDDDILGKSWSFLPQSINLYQQQLKKVDSIIKVQTQKPFEFSKPDNLNWPFSSYAANDADLALRWQKYIKYEVLKGIAREVADSNGLTSVAPPNMSQLETKERAEVKKRELAYVKNLLSTPAELITDLEERYLNTVASCYDPHSNYFSTGKKNEFEAATSASEFSTGIELDENSNGDIAIDYLQPGSSAWRSGKLHKGDVIQSIKINGEEKSVKEMDEEELDEALNGSKSAEVSITVKSAAGEIKAIKLPKEKIEDDEAVVKSYVLKGNQNFGYINLPGFYSRENEEIANEKDIKFDGCANDLSKEIIKLKKDNIAGLVLDLRNNGGGSMWEAMQLAGIFIDIGPVALVKGLDGKVVSLKDPNRGTIYDGPMVVLVNGASASASEFLSAALQDYKRAIIVGGNTYGKGSAQYVQPLDTLAAAGNSKSYNDFVKVTGSKFYRVNGGTTQWAGVIPDILLPDLFSNLDYKEKNDESALLPDDVKPAYYKALPELPTTLLAQKSAERLTANTFFTQLSNFMVWQKKQLAEQKRTLQWASYSKEFNEKIKMYQNVEKASSSSNIIVKNNAFDEQRLMQSSSRSKETNTTHLKEITEDAAVLEAYNILMDWLGK
jgi:carboxyl-terminal processing protease